MHWMSFLLLITRGDQLVAVSKPQQRYHYVFLPFADLAAEVLASSSVPDWGCLDSRSSSLRINKSKQFNLTDGNFSSYAPISPY